MTSKLLWNCWIMANYAGAAVWWGFHKSIPDVLYWIAAASITAVVTFGYNH